MNFQNIFWLSLLKSKIIGYIDRVRCKITELALTGYNYEGAYSPLWAFFMRKISMLLHLNGEAGEGHLRMCRFPMLPVDQPFSASSPKSFGRD